MHSILLLNLTQRKAPELNPELLKLVLIPALINTALKIYFEINPLY